MTGSCMPGVLPAIPRHRTGAGLGDTIPRHITRTHAVGIGRFRRRVWARQLAPAGIATEVPAETLSDRDGRSCCRLARQGGTSRWVCRPTNRDVDKTADRRVRARCV